MLDEGRIKAVIDKVPEGMKICVVSVVGAFRTGKSFILDFFLRYLQQEEGAADEDFDWVNGVSHFPITRLDIMACAVTVPPLLTPGTNVLVGELLRRRACVLIMVDGGLCYRLIDQMNRQDRIFGRMPKSRCESMCG